VETETIGPTTVLVAEQLPEADLRVSLERNGRTGGKLIRLVKVSKQKGALNFSLDPKIKGKSIIEMGMGWQKKGKGYS
jgi:hypothetical protein